jgi:hypothetical protein
MSLASIHRLKGEEMRFTTQIKTQSGVHNLDLDLSQTEMSSAQQSIVAKLTKSLQGQVIDGDAQDPCEDGKCLASKYLSEDEFSQIRGLRADIATAASPAGIGIIIDFCVHPFIKQN